MSSLASSWRRYWSYCKAFGTSSKTDVFIRALLGRNNRIRFAGHRLSGRR